MNKIECRDKNNCNYRGLEVATCNVGQCKHFARGQYRNM
jgi:hypothetical protein